MSYLQTNALTVIGRQALAQTDVLLEGESSCADDSSHHAATF
jgi:hypothetical protein